MTVIISIITGIFYHHEYFHLIILLSILLFSLRTRNENIRTYGILYVLSLIGGEVLTGSWRPENQLEIWDYGSGKRVTGE